MSYDNVQILTKTLQILNAGCYELNGKAVTLQLSKAQITVEIMKMIQATSLWTIMTCVSAPNCMIQMRSLS